MDCEPLSSADARQIDGRKVDQQYEISGHVRSHGPHHPAMAKACRFGHLAELAAGKEQFPAPLLGLAAQQRMLCKQIEKPLEVCERSSCYLDARHARARGRRTDLPATRASR